MQNVDTTGENTIEKNASTPESEPIPLSEDKPVTLTEIVIEEVAIDGICGVY